MKRKRILTVLIVLALVFIWGNSLVSRELSGKISDDILFFLNAAAEKVGLGPDAFTYMTDEDGDGVAEQPTSHLIRKAAHVTEYAVFAALLFLRLESAGKKRFFTAWGLGTLTGAIDETLQIFSHRGSQVRDVLIDTAGALLGLGVGLILYLIKCRKETSLFLCAGADNRARRRARRAGR